MPALDRVLQVPQEILFFPICFTFSAFAAQINHSNPSKCCEEDTLFDWMAAVRPALFAALVHTLETSFRSRQNVRETFEIDLHLIPQKQEAKYVSQILQARPEKEHFLENNNAFFADPTNFRFRLEFQQHQTPNKKEKRK